MEGTAVRSSEGEVTPLIARSSPDIEAFRAINNRVYWKFYMVILREMAFKRKVKVRFNKPL